MSSRRRGFDAERELALRLWRSGFAVVRGPASGARARRLTYPDLVAIYRGRIFVFEVKYRHSLPFYIERGQAERLLEFSRRAGGFPLLAVKVPRKGWFIVPLDAAESTGSGRLRVDEATLNKGESLEEFIRRVTNRGLEDYMEGRPGKLSSQPRGGGSGRE